MICMKKSVTPSLNVGLSLLAALIVSASCSEDLTKYVDPLIGADCAGSTTVGPCMPFGMVKPGPDCTDFYTTGYMPMKIPVEGFSQNHLSGTDGPSRYGNVLLMPFSKGLELDDHTAMRETEEMTLGHYACTLGGSGIKVEITSGDRAALYRISYPATAPLHGLEIDAGHCLGDCEPNEDHCFQWNIDAEAVWEESDPFTVSGYTVTDGGVGHTVPYTVYYFISLSAPAVQCVRTDKAVNLVFDEDVVTARVGISYLSAEKARANAGTVPDDFSKAEKALRDAWKPILSRVRVPRDTPESLKKMLYTGLFHVCQMPTDRTGEVPGGAPVDYDDYYALWDTYRTVMPLLTILDAQRTADIVGGMLEIWKREGYLPDLRAGGVNGSVQGGTTADAVISDAFFKGVPGIDYETALDAMLTDAYKDPGEKGGFEGRTGLDDYIRLGYVPSDRYIRAGSRTVDYSFLDALISKMADSLGRKDVAADLERRSHNWKNVWDSQARALGFEGFMVPKGEDGTFADSIMLLRIPPEGVAVHEKVTSKGLDGSWRLQFYEANAVESSLCVPHDVDGLIALCGGREEFERRLDAFFDGGYIDAGNEPSFLSSCLYHWVGRPDRSYDRVRELMDGFFAGPCGIPGNDDSGAMSAWYIFHALGLYPDAGFPFYILHTPAVPESEILLSNGRRFRIVARWLSLQNRFITAATLDGKPYPYSTLSHEDLMKGGTLVLTMGPERGTWGEKMFRE